MKLKFSILVILQFVISALGQEPAKPFSKAVQENIKLYNVYSNVAYEKGDLEKGKYLFDTLVSNQLVGTKFEDYTFRKIYGGKLKLSQIKKPILIQTYASWCILNKGESIALNKLSKKYAKNLQIIVLFWDKKQVAKNVANQFSGYIELCYANESYNRDEQIVALMKYAIGYLTSYYIDQNLKIINIQKGTISQLPRKTPMKECVQFNYDFYEKTILDLLQKTVVAKN